LQMSDMTKKMQQKNIQNQKFLEDADQQVKFASNKLNDLQSEEARGDKPMVEAKTGIMTFQTLQETEAKMCNTSDKDSDISKAKKELETAEAAK